MTSFKIILSTFLLAISYGIIHDLVTAHLCLEYFTKGHPKLIESESPILLACTWGFVATWWLALPMGLLISFFNQFGHYPPLGFTEIFHLLKNLALFMFLFVFLSGILGFLLSELNVIFLILLSVVYRLVSFTHTINKNNHFCIISSYTCKLVVLALYLDMVTYLLH